ncbi:MAG: GNAT family N-acetyltransferase [Candidatus Methanofastidiosia archaeon]
MKIEIVNLTERNLKDAPEFATDPFSCKYCVYWEFPEECIDKTKERKEDMLQKKLKWLESTKKKFGNCGKIMYVDSKPCGYAQYALPALLPKSRNYDSHPTNDAVLISCLFISQKEFRGLGLGSKLLQSIIKDLKKRGMEAVETFARKGKPDNPSGPVEFYLKNGFRIHRNDTEFPLMRLDL